jgi:hypothetical protein
MKLVVLLFDVPQSFFTGRRDYGEFGLHNSYTRVRDPGNMRHVFQNNKAFMTMVKDIARLNLLPVDFLSPRVEQYRALETQLLAKQQALIAELPLKYDSWRTGPEKSKNEPAPDDERAWLRCDGQMRGLLEELRGLGAAEVTAVNAASELTHLGAVHRFGWNAMWGFKYSIPLEIRQPGAKQGQHTHVRWKEGWQLIYALSAMRPWHDWSELRDDAGAVYWRTAGDEKGNELLAGLQREIEQNADSERRLILVCCKVCCR